MIVVEPVSLPVTETSQVGVVRRTAAEMTESMGFDDILAGQVAIIVTELANNLHRHGGGGELVLRPVQTDKHIGLELLAIDRGQGMTNLGQAMRDGFSTGGTPGTGLGAIERLAHTFDVYTEPGRGTILLARLWQGGQAPKPLLETGVVCLPKPGEDACGDAWAMAGDLAAGRTTIIVADGLGHGHGAAAASKAAIDLFYEYQHLPPGQIVELIHAGLRGTRGAAVSVAEIQRGQSKLNFAGLGNVVAVLVSGLTVKSLVSHNGTAGVEARRVQEFSYDWSSDSMLVMHSDGIAQHWALDKHRGLIIRDPSIIAGLLYRDHRRIRDDATALVARESQPS